MRKLWVGFLLALVLIVGQTVPLLAAAGTTQDITVTATPAFLSIELDVTTWVPNDIVGDGVTPKGTIGPDTVYHSNPLGDETSPSDPVVDGECRFTIDNTSTVAIDLTVNFPDHTGGDASTNSDTGANGATTFGAYSYCTGMTYSTGKVIAKTTGSDPMKENLAADTDLQMGLTYESQSDAWTSGSAMASTVVVTATVYMA